MAWNPSLEVAVARESAKKLDAKQVVVVYIKDNGQFGMASYGETKELCKLAGELGDFLFDSTAEWLMEEGVA